MLILRNVRPWGMQAQDVAIHEGRITAIGADLTGGHEEIDGRGDLLLPGLHDHHLHLAATAARRCSINLAGLTSESAVVAAIRNATGSILRAVDYDECVAGLPDAALLDRWEPVRPLRLADRTGALWALNSHAMALLGTEDLPPGAERDEHGFPTGRFWREDAWMRAFMPSIPLDFGSLGSELAAVGLVGLTDATSHNGPAESALLRGRLSQRLTLMGNEELPAGEGYTRGPLKLLIDERDPPMPEVLARRIAVARTQGRAVAAHCVTEMELALYLAALDLAGGARPGDRVEHGGLVSPAFVPLLAATKLTVVTNPAFIRTRGERYRAEVPPEHWASLYPAATLARAGVPLLGGSDAPYAPTDPWLAMRAARDRLTEAGHPVGACQRLDSFAALRLYCSGDIEVGQFADLIICRGSLAEVLHDLSPESLRLTLIGGRIAFYCD